MNYGFIGKIVKEGSTSDWQSDLVAKFEEFTTMVNDASAIVDDIDARYDAFADAEAYMLQHALTMPAVYEVVVVPDPRQRILQDQRHVRHLQLQVR